MRSKFIFILLASLSLFACEKEDQKKEESLQVRPVPVQITTAEQRTLSEAIVSTSTIDSRSSIDLVAEVPGVITNLEVEQGDTVSKKQKLARVRREELSFGVQTAAASVRRLKEEVERLKPLYDKGIVSKQVYDEAQYRLETAQSEQRRASSAAGDATVRATSDGVVAIRYINLGQQVATGTPLFRIVDPDDLLVYVNLPEQVLGQDVMGRKVIIESDALKETRFSGVVEKVSPVVDPRTGTVRVTIGVVAAPESEPNKVRLRPGMFVRTRIVTQETDGLAVPRRALVYADNTTFIFAVSPEKSAVRRRVTTGLIDGDYIEIKSGLTEKEQVIVVGQEGLKEGAPLEIETVDSQDLGI